MAKTEIRSVRDLPFPELDRFTLLHLSPDRVDLDLDNYGFGYGRLNKIALVETEVEQRTKVAFEIGDRTVELSGLGEQCPALSIEGREIRFGPAELGRGW